MAGDWIKMRMALATDKDVGLIADKLGIETDLAVGRLHRFWSWASDNTCDGWLPKVTAKAINRVVAHDGFAEALEHARWLKITPTGVRIPKFERHMADSAKARAGESLRRGALRRSEKSAGGGRTDKRTDSCTDGSPDKSGSRAEYSKRAAESKSSEKETKDSNAAAAAAIRSGGEASAVSPQEHPGRPPLAPAQERIRSRLLEVRVGGDSIFEPVSATAIASHPNASELQVTWAIERLRIALRKDRSSIENPGGYLRQLIEHEEVPPNWRRKYARQVLSANLPPLGPLPPVKQPDGAGDGQGGGK